MCVLERRSRKQVLAVLVIDRPITRDRQGCWGSSVRIARSCPGIRVFRPFAAGMCCDQVSRARWGDSRHFRFVGRQSVQRGHFLTHQKHGLSDRGIGKTREYRRAIDATIILGSRLDYANATVIVFWYYLAVVASTPNCILSLIPRRDSSKISKIWDSPMVREADEHSFRGMSQRRMQLIRHPSNLFIMRRWIQ